MKFHKLIAMSAVSGLLTLAVAAPALGADSISVTDTGPGSVNQASVNNNNTVNSTNNNNMTVVNTNSQTATTGTANVSGNTNAGSATSGNATNNNTTTTTVAVNNGPAVGGGVLPTGGGAGGGSIGAQGGTGGGSLPANVGGGTLPNTGALNPIDVSALRNALANTASARTGSGLSAALLSLAAILSLIGAIGSALYAGKKIA